MNPTFDIGDTIYYNLEHPFIASVLGDMTDDEKFDLFKTSGVIVGYRGAAAIILNNDFTTSVVPPDCLIGEQLDRPFTFLPVSNDG
jgi:hypothetical protein